MMTRAWKWIVTGLAAIGGMLTLAWLWRRGEKKEAKATRELADARLEAEAELGEQHIEETERAAKEAREDGMAEHGSLAEYLNDRTGND